MLAVLLQHWQLSPLKESRFTVFWAIWVFDGSLTDKLICQIIDVDIVYCNNIFKYAGQFLLVQENTGMAFLHVLGWIMSKTLQLLWQYSITVWMWSKESTWGKEVRVFISKMFNANLPQLKFFYSLKEVCFGKNEQLSAPCLNINTDMPWWII